jgi:hypothetical protein
MEKEGLDKLIQDVAANVPKLNQADRQRFFRAPFQNLQPHEAAEQFANVVPEGARRLVTANLIKDLPEPERKQALTDGLKGFSKKDQKTIVAGASGIAVGPDPVTRNSLWRMVIVSFCTVLILSFVALAVAIFMEKADYQVLLTVFTTVVGFLAGLFAPSPTNSDADTDGK